MTDLIAPPVTRSHAASRRRVTFAHLLRSEALKLVTVRSTWWSLAVAAVLSVGISAMIAGASADFGPDYPAVNVILSPTQFTMLVAGILGTIAVTGEYSTGMIRSTLTAAPRRGAVVVAKAVPVAILMGLATTAIFATAIAVTAPILTEGIDWSEPSQSSVPLGYGVLSMVAFTLMGLGFGFTIRAGAGAIAATVGVLFVLPMVIHLFAMAGDGWQWLVDLGDHLPMNAAATLTTPGADEVLPSLYALAGWTAAPLLLGWGVLRTRDA